MKKLTVQSIALSGPILYAAVTSAMLNSAFVNIAIETHSTVSKMVLATGYQTLVIGMAHFAQVLGRLLTEHTRCDRPIFNAIARKYGKRPVLISRVLQGFSIAPYESLIFTLISDLFFVHERGID